MHKFRMLPPGTLGLAGNRLQVDELSGRTVEYTYDSLYRLTDEEITDPVQGNAVISYTYDKVGNRLTKTVDSVTRSYTYNDNDRLEDDGSATYLYDDNGNLTHQTEGSETTEYIYDDSNRLVQINHPTDTIYYWYDHNGIRTAKQVNTVLYRYLIDANRPYAQVLEEYEESTLAASYLYGDDLIAQNRGELSYYLYDGQLSSRQLVNSSGAVTDSYDYDAFGNLLNSSGSTQNDYLYTGEQFDPNAGFYYLRARYYDQGSGRFTSVDPYAGNMHEPITLHRYLYAGDNPVMKVDPSGEFTSFIEIMAALGIENRLKEADFAKKVQTTRKGFRSYCRAVASNVKMYIKPFKDLLKQTGGTNFASHHIFQDAEMKSIFQLNYSRGIGFAMPVLGKFGQLYSPHWIMNQAQRKHKGSKDPIEVARLSLRAAGCRKCDVEEIVEFVEAAFELVDIIF